MRRIVSAGLALVAAVAIVEVPGANGQVSNGRNPWCIRDGALGSGSWDCTYRTFEQCRFSAHGAGGTCSINPEYRGPPLRGFDPYTGQYDGFSGFPGNNWGWGSSRGRW
jgi:Protein of unknown function (DUF3551)